MKGRNWRLLLVACLSPVIVVLSLHGQGAKRPAVVRRLGLLLADAARYQAVTVGLRPLAQALPPSVDLSADMPPVGDQGSEDSCAAWSSTYAIRTYIERAELGWNVGTPTAQFSPAYVYNQMTQGSCSVGLALPDVLNFLTSQGASTLAAMPYADGNCGAQPTTEARQQASEYRIAGYRRVNPQSLTDVKSYLSQKFPLLVAVDVDSAWMNLGANQIWKTHGASQGNHAMAVVGYDDSAHAVKLFNSWGTGWGTGGYGYIDYDLFPQVVREAYIVNPIHSHTPDTAVPQEAAIHVLTVAAAPNSQPALNLQIQYSLRGYQGHSIQVVVYFWFQNGQPVPAMSAQYADINGNAAVSTGAGTAQSNDYNNVTFNMTVPTTSLNVPGGQYYQNGGQVMYQPQMTALLASADLFVDNFGLAQSQFFSFYAYR